MITRAVDTLVKESAITGTIFFRIHLKHTSVEDDDELFACELRFS